MNSRRIIFKLSFGYFATMVYFTGCLVADGVTLFAKDFAVMLESKFEIFLAIFFSQPFCIVGAGCFLVLLFTLPVKIFEPT